MCKMEETMSKLVVSVRFAVLGLCIMLLSGDLRVAWADTYPNRPVRFIVPFPVGGSADILARIMSERLAIVLGQPVVVDNRPGAGGNIGADITAKSVADG